MSRDIVARLRWQAEKLDKRLGVSRVSVLNREAAEKIGQLRGRVAVLDAMLEERNEADRYWLIHICNECGIGPGMSVDAVISAFRRQQALLDGYISMEKAAKQEAMR